MKKISIVSIIFLIAILPQIVRAQVVITEIMYDPHGSDSGHEWIEVYNSSAAPVLFTSWKIYEDNTGHKIIAATSSKSFAAHSFAIIAASVSKFQADYPDFTGQLFHSALSLNNSGATIELHDASSTAVDSVAYDSNLGGLNDGNSLQRPPDDNAQFAPYAPSPGVGISTNTIPPKVKEVTPAKTTKQKSTTKKSSKNATANDSVDSYSVDTEHTDAIATSSSVGSQVAAVNVPNSSDSYWWLSAGALAVLAGGTLIASRRVKKTEWDIVEEKPEDV